ncbi:hypothetical protein I9Y33_002681 [Clostridium perfringens]|nr:hypothetical protein [Clostridium perfringens]
MNDLICLSEENLLRDLKSIEVKINNIKNVICNVYEGGRIKAEDISIAKKDIQDLNKYFRYINKIGIDKTIKQNLFYSGNKLIEEISDSVE